MQRVSRGALEGKMLQRNAMHACTVAHEDCARSGRAPLIKTSTRCLDIPWQRFKPPENLLTSESPVRFFASLLECNETYAQELVSVALAYVTSNYKDVAARALIGSTKS